MEMTNRDSGKLFTIDLNTHTYTLVVPIKHTMITDLNSQSFLLVERYTQNEINIIGEYLNTEDDLTFFMLTIPFDEHKQVFLENEIWDLYYTFEKEGEFKKRRVKSNYDNIRFQSIVLKEDKKMFYPYTTKNGKLSFRSNGYILYSKIENVVIKENEIGFSGFFIFPPYYNFNDFSIEELNLVVNTSIDDEEIYIPLERFYREDIKDKYNGNENIGKCGIKGDFPYIKHINTEQKKYFKFYVEMVYKEGTHLTKIRSTRVRLNHLSDFPLKRIINYEGDKIKLIVKPTRKSKFLSFQMSKYDFKNEVINQVKKKWIQIRRSDILKQAYKVAFYLLGKLPVKKNTIIFESFLGKQYSDSPRAIYEYLEKNNSGYEMYWSADRRHIEFFKDKDVKAVRRFSIKWLLLMARAGYWVSNSRLPLWIPKPKHTTYLQTWHGTPLKRLAADMEEVHMPGTNTVKYKQNFIKEASKWDYLVSPNAYSSEIFERAFQFNKEMVESGYPRNDFLVNENNVETINKIKETASLPLDKKVILYAPTWRDNQFYEKGKYKFDLQMDLELMKEKLEKDYIIVLRLHYLVAENLDLTGYEGFVYDFSYHEDIRELYLIADMLITDYSSVFFDYANLKRPMLFFVYDIEDYRDNLRGFYFDFEEKAPGPLVKTTQELISEIKNIEELGFSPSETTQSFHSKFCYLEDGNASKRVVERVFE
ncbi:CDP-glycerol glycerophosphotransferase family protein [Virgibacillus halodenitrificans]|uniref:CDP-glycerol glycerophosphotransferase family protein n=1 Tax=Virgibacillus halodenitrificans TaxID=1482 RepID=UPI001FB2AEC5|nr:CDP-glycerol glycerophosphotransferase family protein [Virgibacillus halodenitrificans]MCJ0929621.1 CDP-glycerol glycerophosphotransferase family protein [Virgibacillus halodenitrificans]WHX26076.1 CDP-glycerol glycerophosphotransferase family protein [Virgibacillus halodenitrificans]